jgi:hypothetical protein
MTLTMSLSAARLSVRNRIQAHQNWNQNNRPVVFRPQLAVGLALILNIWCGVNIYE